MNVFMAYAGRNRKLEKIDTHFLEQFQKKRLKKSAYSTVNRELVYIIRMLRMNGLIIQKPSPKPGKVTYQRAFSKDELARFFTACPERLSPLYLLMLASGARKSELVPSPFSTHIALLKKELDLEKRVMVLRTAKQRTGMMMTPMKPRIIPLPEWVIEPLREQMKQNKGKHVFTELRNHPRDFNLIIEQAKIEKFDAVGHKVTAHSFRHTYATLMAEMVGHNAFILKEALGHARITTTERYCHPTSPILELSLSWETPKEENT